MPTIAFHKPYGVLSRFTPDGSSWRTLAEFALPKDVWPVGRLDADSEGLLLLTSDKALVDRLLHPRRAHPRTYWVEVERIPDAAALDALRGGVVLRGEKTAPLVAERIDPPTLLPRDPPARSRDGVPTCWLALTLGERKNRQVRRATAAVGHPTLRLVRAAIGDLELGDLAIGCWRALGSADIVRLLQPSQHRLPQPKRARRGR